MFPRSKSPIPLNLADNSDAEAIGRLSAISSQRGRHTITPGQECWMSHDLMPMFQTIVTLSVIPSHVLEHSRSLFRCFVRFPASCENVAVGNSTQTGFLTLSESALWDGNDFDNVSDFSV